MKILGRMWSLLRRGKVDAEIDEELRGHMEMRVADNVAAGMSEEKAWLDARLRFGNPSVMKEKVTAVDAALGIESVLTDVRYALRKLRRSPGFALVAVLSLTMAIAANVVVFGVLNALILHPLPVPGGDRVFQIQRLHELSMSYPNYRDVRDRNQTFSDVAMFRIARIGLDADGNARPVWGYEVSGNYFDMLGVKPLLGRFLHSADDVKANGSPYAVLSYACWKVRFGGDPNVVGRVVRLNKHPYVVVGVAPKDFQGTERFLWPELWVPVQNEEQIEGYGWLDSRGNNNSWDVGRLRTAVTVPQANADLAGVAAQLAKDHPDVDKNLTMVVARPGLLGDALGGPMHAFLYGVMGLAALVLLAACANLGGLFATRTADRARELGIRIAIGSSRGRIVRQLLTESVLISVIGGIAAAVVASVLLHGITVWHPHVEIPVQFLVEPDRVVILFSILLALLTGILFGIIPARQVWQTDPNQVLKAAGATSATQRRFALRDILLAVQIALCSLLVTASFVSFRGLQRTFAMPLGIHPEGVTLATLDVHLAGYNNEQFLPLERRLLDAVTHVPGVNSAAYANTTPLSANQSNNSIFAPGTTDFKQANAKFWANSYKVSSAYFAVAGTHLLAGRVFTDHDDAHAPRVAIVNEAFARRLFGTTNVIGKHFPVNDRTAAEVVGVVEDGKYETLTEDPRPAVFWPMLQQPSSDTVLLVRSERGASETIPLVRKAIAGVDPALPVFSLGTWSDGLSMVTLPARAATIALGVLGALAMMLAVTGIFGLASYTVAKRMHELGIRVALGAQSVQVLRAALGRTLLLLGIGSTTGLMLGVAASRVLASIIYQATASDPLVIISVVVTMALTGLVSAMVPARKAVSADPAKLLRAE